MRFSKKLAKASSSHSEYFSVSAVIGGQKYCLHRWMESIDRVSYSGPRPPSIGYNDSTYAARCIECGRVTVSTSVSRAVAS